MNPLTLSPAGAQSVSDKPVSNATSSSGASSKSNEFNNLYNSSLQQQTSSDESGKDTGNTLLQTAALTASAQGGQGLPPAGNLLPPAEPEGLPVSTPAAEEKLDHLLADGLQALASTETVPVTISADHAGADSQQLQSEALTSGIVALNTLATNSLTDHAATLASKGVTVTTVPGLTNTLSQVANADNALLKTPTPSLPGQTIGITTDSGLNQQLNGGESGLTGQESRSSLPVSELSLPDINDKQDFRLIEKQLAHPTRDILGAVTNQVTDGVNKLTPESLKLLGETYQLQQPLHKPNWSQEFGNRMVWLAKEGIQSAQLRLNPASLGKIDISISIQNDQASISFLSQHGAVKDVIDASMPRLREMLNDAGIKLDQVNVSTQANAQEQKQSNGTHAGVTHGSQTGNQQDDTQVPMEEETRPHVTEMLSAVDYYA